MYGPDVTILLIFESHDMRHTGFRRLTVANGTPGNGESQSNRRKSVSNEIENSKVV